MKITYPVPAETTSVFLVAVDRRPSDLSSVVPWRMGRPHGRAAMAAFGTPRLEMETFRRSRSPWRSMDLEGDSCRHVRRARHHVVVSSTAPVADQPVAAQVARAAARGVAETYKGVIFDASTGAAVDHGEGCTGERPDFRLGDDWLGWSAEVGVANPCAPDCPLNCVPNSCASHAYARTSAPQWDPTATDVCSCLRVRTRGLRRFGLPEIKLEHPACAHSLCTAHVLRTVAQRLLVGHLAWLAENPAARSRTISEHVSVDGTGFGVLLGSPDLDSDPLQVRLTRNGASRSCLRVGPSTGTGHPATDWCHSSGLLAA